MLDAVLVCGEMLVVTVNCTIFSTPTESRKAPQNATDAPRIRILCFLLICFVL